MVKESKDGKGKAAVITAIAIILMIAISNSIGYVGNAIADASHHSMWIVIAGTVAFISGIMLLIESKEVSQ